MKKILIAEDDKFLANAYRVKLEKSGYEAKIAEDGQEALEVIGEFQPDLVLLDIIMPKKDGFGVLEELRSNPKYKNLPIIIASNLGQEEDVKKGKELGANDFVIKSNMGIGEILAKVEKLLAK